MPESCTDLSKQLEAVQKQCATFWNENHEAVMSYMALENEYNEAHEELSAAEQSGVAKEALDDLDQVEGQAEAADRRAEQAQAALDAKDAALSEAQRAVEDAENAPLSGAVPDRALEVHQRNVEIAEERLARAEAAWDKAWEEAVEAEEEARAAHERVEQARNEWNNQYGGLNEDQVRNSSGQEISDRIESAKQWVGGVGDSLEADKEGEALRGEWQGLSEKAGSIGLKMAGHGCF
jgi:chromosome segregation ATPase